MIKYFRKQVYEIDIVAVYLQIEKEINEGKIKYSSEISGAEYLERLKTSIEVILEPDGVDVDQLLALKIPVVITPRFHIAQYEFWFAFQLTVINYRKIPFMLLYHFERWQNNIHFLNLLEFQIDTIYEVVAEKAEVREQPLTVLIREEVIVPLAQIFKQFLFTPNDYEDLILALKGFNHLKAIKLFGILASLAI
ncbi:MAG: hypothetical protein IPH24_17640 [Crocinitomicaceae bacterium]|nr:hypothetical protein [Crocinitomicaceae bacterium]